MTNHPDTAATTQTAWRPPTDLAAHVLAAAYRAQRAVGQQPGYAGESENVRASRPTPAPAWCGPQAPRRIGAGQPDAGVLPAEYTAAVNALRRMIAELDSAQDRFAEAAACLLPPHRPCRSQADPSGREPLIPGRSLCR